MFSCLLTNIQLCDDACLFFCLFFIDECLNIYLRHQRWSPLCTFYVVQPTSEPFLRWIISIAYDLKMGKIRIQVTIQTYVTQRGCSVQIPGKSYISWLFRHLYSYACLVFKSSPFYLYVFLNYWHSFILQFFCKKHLIL
jgi:hypothetical protein